MRRRSLSACAVLAAAAALAAVPSVAGAAPSRPPASSGTSHARASAASPAKGRTAPSPAGAVQEPVATGTGGAVASMDQGASAAGIDVLKQGGNAVDAAVATASALGVTNPFVAGPGGGGFMVIYLAKTHQVVTINGRETCPQACSPTMFTDPKTGKSLDYNYASDQPLSTGVPSMVATWASAIRQYGSKTLAADLQPAIALGDSGFRVNADFQQLTQSALPVLQAYPASRKLLLTNSGDPLPVGSLLRNPDLAKTYRLLARYGPSYLYDGPIGQAIVNADDHPAVTPGNNVVTMPGIMQMSDLRGYATRTQAPTQVSYRGFDVYGMAPPSSSGSTVGEALNILRGWNVGAEPRATALFHYLEASRLAYADRNAYVGDPRYVRVPLKGLLDPAFAATRRCLVGQTALRSPVAPGNPYPPYQGCQTPSNRALAGNEGLHTNNIVTADKWGDVVGYTNTINFFGGSGETVPGYGFLLNNEMTDFDLAPPSAGTSDPNLPAGGKQPRSSMGPVIAFRDGKPQFTVGAAGGSTIPTTILQIMMNHVDLGMPLPAALAAPRVSQRNTPTSLAEPDFYHSTLASQLTSQFGEQFTLATGPILPLDYYPGDATALQVLPDGSYQAVAEPVRLGGGSALTVNPSG